MAKRGKSPRAQVPLRIPEALRARLEEAAKEAGRSMNAEITDRLEGSFGTEYRLRPKRMGRPTKTPKAGERISLGLRVTADIKTKLDAAARHSARSQSQEAEFRLERTFADDDRLWPGAQDKDAVFAALCAALVAWHET